MKKMIAIVLMLTAGLFLQAQTQVVVLAETSPVDFPGGFRSLVVESALDTLMNHLFDSGFIATEYEERLVNPQDDWISDMSDYGFGFRSDKVFVINPQWNAGSGTDLDLRAVKYGWVDSSGWVTQETWEKGRDSSGSSPDPTHVGKDLGDRIVRFY